MNSFGIQAFISYSSRDLELAREVHRLLMSQQFSYRVWRDEREIERDWSRETEQRSRVRGRQVK